MASGLDWQRDGRAWPNRAASRFVEAGGLRWHVQQLGAGPVMLLAHGAGASTHSWRDLAPLLAERFTVVAPDLPGHGFTAAPPFPRLSLAGMAWAMGALVRALGVAPAVAVGHSAGAAVLARMCLDGALAPRALVSLNGALLPMFGAQNPLFSTFAKLVALSPFVPWLFTMRAADPAVVTRLIGDTGSTISAEGLALYRLLARDPKHVAAALGMMANWDLAPLARALPHLEPALTLIIGADDRTIPPSDAEKLRRIVPTATLVAMPGLGHLAHEERPRDTADLIFAAAGRAGVTMATEETGE